MHETGNVNTLQIENLGDQLIFVQAGDIVKGGRQDRTVAVSLLLPQNRDGFRSPPSASKAGVGRSAAAKKVVPSPRRRPRCHRWK